jgi:hypothetical protein
MNNPKTPGLDAVYAKYAAKKRAGWWDKKEEPEPPWIPPISWKSVFLDRLARLAFGGKPLSVKELSRKQESDHIDRLWRDRGNGVAWTPPDERVEQTVAPQAQAGQGAVGKGIYLPSSTQTTSPAKPAPATNFVGTPPQIEDSVSSRPLDHTEPAAVRADTEPVYRARTIGSTIAPGKTKPLV